MTGIYLLDSFESKTKMGIHKRDVELTTNSNLRYVKLHVKLVMSKKNKKLKFQIFHFRFIRIQRKH